ncbi:hypothetical protein F7725_018308 [Dissostichus mawsoni]|uniref:Uncharacterized protein n=1 Tax=Dissostichus mawsoni TaxID=36200 RepID=A0A7J5XRW1_DISMA|nr:hypothetical protein F7725_018308 [Dissostichus mawsoni]
MVVQRAADLTWVTVCEQGADGQQHLGDGEGGAPVVLQDVQTDHPLTVDVAVIDPRTESVKAMSRKKTPPSYTEPGGPRMVDLHS